MNKRNLAIAAAGFSMAYYHVISKRKNRSKWIKAWISKRDEFGHMPLLQELRVKEPNDFKNYLRMSATDFGLLLNLLRLRLTKQDTVMRSAIPAEERLIATLRFVATGRSYEDLKFSTGIAAQTLGVIIPETCRIIYEVLKEDYLKIPQTSQEWKETAQGFKDRWQMINCGGCIDGKHIRIMQPPNSGALYYNYKNFYSVVLMAIVNSNYEFLYIDVGKQGRLSDGGVIKSTTFYSHLENGTLKLPHSSQCDENLNFVFIGDEAFAQEEHILKPYSQRDLNNERRIYNYRLSRARNVVENAFGLITNRFRVLLTAIHVSPQNINYIVLAICTLHNFLIKRSASYVTTKTFDTEDNMTCETAPGAWRNNSVQVDDICAPLQGNARKNSTERAKRNRECYLKFFNENGKVPWQDEMIRKGKA